MKARSLLVSALALAGVALPVTGQLGTVVFENSGAARAQAPFIRGVLLLHSFEYGPAGAAFREAQDLDPDFALAYWGEAMTYNHPVWFRQDRDAARTALDRFGPTPADRIERATTERERHYLRAVDVLFGDGPKASRDTAYADAMRKLMERYPLDPEAKAFYALALLGTSHGGRHVPTYMRAGALAEEVFRDNPNHPGAVHYMIHAYDDPTHAPLGLRAARAYAKIAPAASHAQHMTSHIFVALGMWDDVVAANVASFEVSGGANYHALHWLAYGYLQQGRRAAALANLGIIRLRPRPSRVYVGRMWATHVVAARPWVRPDPILDVPMSEEDIQATPLSVFADGFVAVHQGDEQRASQRVKDLERMRGPTDGASIDGDARRMSIEAQRLALEATIQFSNRAFDRTLDLMRAAMDVEDRMPFEFGPPVIVKPTHELMGEMLLDLDRPAEATRHFLRALELAPNRALSLLGLARAAHQNGDAVLAAETYATLDRLWAHADVDLRELQEVRSRATVDLNLSRR